METPMQIRNPQSEIRNAFTLIELLVVIAIIITLLAILIPSMNKALETAMDNQCRSKMRQSVLATLNYANDNFGAVFTVMNGWQGNGLYDTDGGPAVGSKGILYNKFVPDYLPNMETWSCVFSTVPNIDDPRNTRAWTYGSFAYWPFNRNLTPDFGTGNGTYPDRLSEAQGSTPLIQDKVSDNRTWRYAPGWAANHTTGNHWVWDAMNNVNPSNVNRRTDDVKDVRGANIGTWDMAVSWYTMDEMEIAMIDGVGRPLYSAWPGN